MTGTIEDDAKVAAGNWQKWTCFVWDRDRDLEDAANWTIVYTHNRDSGLLAQSNAAQIEQAIDPFTKGDDPDVVMESHSHWAVGHVDGMSIRVYNATGEITEAFKTYHGLMEQLEDYPILDEEDYSRRESDATWDNIESEGGYVGRKFDYTLPAGWVGEVEHWLSDNNSSAIENRDDQGGYPSEEELLAAFDALGYGQIEEE